MNMSVVEMEELAGNSSRLDSANIESEKVENENVGSGLGSRFSEFKLLFLCLTIIDLSTIVVGSGSLNLDSALLSEFDMVDGPNAGMDADLGFEDLRMIVGSDPEDGIAVDSGSMASFFVEGPSFSGDSTDVAIDWKGPLSVTECSVRSLYDLVAWNSNVPENAWVRPERGESIIGVEGVDWKYDFTSVDDAGFYVTMVRAGRRRVMEPGTRGSFVELVRSGVVSAVASERPWRRGMVGLVFPFGGIYPMRDSR